MSNEEKEADQPPSKRLKYSGYIEDLTEKDEDIGQSAIVTHTLDNIEGNNNTNDTKQLRTSTLPSPTLTLTGHKGSIYSLKYSPNGELLCSTSFDMTCLL